jgi:hypothetical protein
MMPSGSVNIGVSRGGVRQPSIQLADRAPRVRGGSSGTVGCTGEAATLALGVNALVAEGVEGGGVDVNPPGPCATSSPWSHAAAMNMSAVSATRNLRIVGDLAEDVLPAPAWQTVSGAV